MSDSSRGVHRRAAQVDQRLEESIERIDVSEPGQLLKELRHYIQQRADNRGIALRAEELVRVRDAEPEVVIDMDEGRGGTQFTFPSGHQLSFGVTVRRERHYSRLVSYRFHLQLGSQEKRPSENRATFLRIDLVPKAHEDPLIEPRCHVHLGFEDLPAPEVRLPFPVLHPLEVLDRIFFVVEPP